MGFCGRSVGRWVIVVVVVVVVVVIFMTMVVWGIDGDGVGVMWLNM